MFIKTGIIGTMYAILGTLTVPVSLFSAPINLRLSSAIAGSIFLRLKNKKTMIASSCTIAAHIPKVRYLLS